LIDTIIALHYTDPNFAAEGMIRVTIELRKLTARDGRDVYDMLQEMPPMENGFQNGLNGRTYAEFREWLEQCGRIERGEGLEDWMVPQTVYWLYADSVPVGFGKLRHRLTDRLRVEGGHVGYSIRPSRRGEGHGKRLLELIRREAEAMGIERLLITVQSSNAASIAVSAGNGGVIEKVDGGRHYIWVESKNED